LDIPAIERAAADADLHSVLVWQRGRMLVEHNRRSKDRPVGDWFTREISFGPDVLHDLRSIGKSVVALLVGQAVGRGQINISTPVLDFYPALSDLRRDGREAIQLSHLLDMASGLAWSETASTYGTSANDETRLCRRLHGSVHAADNHYRQGAFPVRPHWWDGRMQHSGVASTATWPIQCPRFQGLPAWLAVKTGLAEPSCKAGAQRISSRIQGAHR
jgi:hypothetical protein